jgi:hypothetical protein
VAVSKLLAIDVDAVTPDDMTQDAAERVDTHLFELDADFRSRRQELEKRARGLAAPWRLRSVSPSVIDDTV